MSVCSHDPYCPGYGPDHDAGLPGEVYSSIPTVPTVEFANPLPPLEELLEARVMLRKQAKSGHPARKAEALRNLFVVERIIRDAKARDAKSEVES